VLVIVFRRRTGMPRLSVRERSLAWLSGLFLAADLVVWSHAIAAIGAGLGTVVPNLQVLFIALIGWLALGERPDRSLLFGAPVMLTGLLMVGGVIGGGHGYGASPPTGIALGVAVAGLYSVFILTLRRAGRTAPVAALFEATLAAAAGSVLLGL